MTEHQRALWIMSAPVLSSYNYAMQGFTSQTFSTSFQHKKETTSKINRDKEDFRKMREKLQIFPPFSNEAFLRNIINSVNATSDVNAHNLLTKDRDIVDKIVWKQVFDFSFTRTES